MYMYIYIYIHINQGFSVWLSQNLVLHASNFLKSGMGDPRIQVDHDFETWNHGDLRIPHDSWNLP